MVKVISRRVPNPNEGIWDIVIEFDLDLDDVGTEGDLDVIADERLHNVIGWISKNFQRNFILMENVEASIAGGWVDNREAWEREPQIDRKSYAWKSSYALRCHEQDGNWFCLTHQ